MAKRRKSKGAKAGSKQWVPKRRSKEDAYRQQLTEELLCSASSVDGVANICDTRLGDVEADAHIAQLFADFWGEQAGPAAAVAGPMVELVSELKRHKQVLADLLGRLDHMGGDEALHQDIEPTPEVMERILAGFSKLEEAAAADELARDGDGDSP